MAVIDGRNLFESAAICTHIADRVPDADLIAKSGTFARAEHDQWVSFCLTEMEAWLSNWGRRQDLLDECPALVRYLERLMTRPHCSLLRD